MFIHHVMVKNYKSIEGCSVDLRPLTFLVGPNGAGKSNFVDALRFLRDGLRSSLDNAMRDRGGINEVRRRSGGHPTHFGIRVEFELPEVSDGVYAFQVAAQKGGAFEVQRELCEFTARSGRRHRFLHEGRDVTATAKPAPAAAKDRLYLVNASGLPEFRPIYDALSSMGFYNLNPDSIRALQAPDSGELLSRDGGNIASVISHIFRHDKSRKAMIEEYLSKVAPAVHGVEHTAVGPRESLEFRQEVQGARHPWKFLANSMSDGTLRALGVLVALFQGSNGQVIPLVAIEEPEVALHPAASGVLLEALREASAQRQVVVTSHSPDLLDDDDLSADEILAVVASGSVTRIAPLDEAARSVLREGLYTAGEMLRINQLTPDVSLFAGGSSRQQPDLFRER